MKWFGLGFLTGFSGLFAGLAGIYAALALFWPASLPAPPLTRLVHLDEKMRFLREHPEFDPRILAVGSSITWRQIAGGEFAKLAGGDRRFLNGATGKLQIHQSRDLLGFYLRHYRNVETVLLMVALPDFEDCTAEPAAMLDHEAAASYAFEGWPEAFFYLRYFAPQRFARTAMTLAERREPLHGDLYLDAFGSGPIQLSTAEMRGLRYEEIATDPACIDALIGLSRDLTARGLRLIVIFTPVHPEYFRAYPGAEERTCWIARRVESATLGHDTRVVLLHDDAAFRAQDFFDAFHLQYSAATRLSARVAQAMRGAASGDVGPADYWIGRHVELSSEPECLVGWLRNRREAAAGKITG